MLGWAIHRAGLVTESFWQPAENITFRVFFPALLLLETASARLDGSGLTAMLAAVLGGILLVAALTFVLRFPLSLDGPAFTSLLQGAIRPNVYVGLAAAHALFGGDSVGLLAVCLAFAIPAVNVISVLALLRWAGPAGARVGPRALIAGLAGNPLIVACVIGLTLNVLGVALPGPLRAVLEILARAALPIGLLAVGAGLRGPMTATVGRPAVQGAAALKLLVLPAITLALCHVLGVAGDARATAVLYAALPCSATAYVMARQMGGDAPLLAGVISLTTVAAAATLPLAVTVAG